MSKGERPSSVQAFTSQPAAKSCCKHSLRPLNAAAHSADAPLFGRAQAAALYRLAAAQGLDEAQSTLGDMSWMSMDASWDMGIQKNQNKFKRIPEA